MPLENVVPRFADNGISSVDGECDPDGLLPM
jgi:hypothetical protein